MPYNYAQLIPILVKFRQKSTGDNILNQIAAYMKSVPPYYVAVSLLYLFTVYDLFHTVEYTKSSLCIRYLQISNRAHVWNVKSTISFKYGNLY